MIKIIKNYTQEKYKFLIYFGLILSEILKNF